MLYNINIWLYTPCGEGKVELFKPVDEFNKGRKDVTINSNKYIVAEHIPINVGYKWRSTGEVPFNSIVK